MTSEFSYDYKVLLDGEGSKEERTEVYRNCTVDLQKREILMKDRDTGEILFQRSRRDILKIVRLPYETH